MTAQLSREIVENLLQHNDESDSPANAEAWEVNALCRLALAGMDSKPVAVIDKEGSPMTRAECNDDRVFAICCKVGTPLYAAPPAPVAVPDEREAFEAWVKFHLDDEHSIVTLHRANGGLNYRDPHVDLAWIAWKESRAAMLKAGPVTAATVPDGLKRAVAFYEQVKRENTPVETGAWKDAVDWVLKEACRAAYPEAPEREV